MGLLLAVTCAPMCHDLTVCFEDLIVFVSLELEAAVGIEPAVLWILTE
jgi:hypothetical protein